MTNREALQLYLKKFDMTGFLSDDLGISERQALRQIKGLLALLKKEALQRKGSLSVNDFDKITLNCIALEEVNRVDNSIFSDSDYTWYKSVETMPRPIKVLSVNDMYGFSKYSEVKWNDISASRNFRLKDIANDPVYSWKNEQDGTHLYLSSEKQDLEAVTMEFIPEDYYEALIFPQCGKVNMDAVCNPLDQEIGASEMIIARVMSLIKGRPQADLQNNDNIT